MTSSFLMMILTAACLMASGFDRISIAQEANDRQANKRVSSPSPKRVENRTPGLTSQAGVRLTKGLAKAAKSRAGTPLVRVTLNDGRVIWLPGN